MSLHANTDRSRGEKAPRRIRLDEEASSEEDEWFDCLDSVNSVKEGMKVVYKMDKEAYYTMGDQIEKMLQHRFENNMDSEE